MKNALFILTSLFFFSCQQKENKTIPVQSADPILTAKTEKKNNQINDTIFMNFKNEEGLYTAAGHLDSIHQRVFVKFENKNSSEINGKIIPETNKANIRFNQIIFPDRSSDGPFGRDLKMQLTQTGNHIIVIGHSQMADDPYWGNFKVQLEIKQTN